uniref:RagB/SusD family nutrient uptake outer membrane protein n=1 Tax=Pedobacter schmidteae TaxID=2201271 RepID=UPI0013CEF699|nr:RagB/SusD family nutrient uptake outer membrane protein [Pedobacter schmidteae]
MNTIKYLLIGLLACLSFTSCKKFLTVNPRTDITQDDFYSSEGGFKDALSGVYIQMKSTTAYGEALTMTTIEQLVSNWDVTNGSIEQKIGAYNYSDIGVQNRMTAIFAQAYSTTASINAILGQIDRRKDVFTTPGIYQQIKGECLALRAYCLFDILRLFGPVPAMANNSAILPYPVTISKSPNQLISFADFKLQLLRDLSDAAELLQGDPIKSYSLDQLGKPGTAPFLPADNLMAYRYLKMNYYAVKAVQARIYLWFNDRSNAYTCAREVIDSKNSDGTLKFRLGVAADLTAKDYALTAEQIFGLYDWDLYDRYTKIFSSGLLKKGSNETMVKNQLYGNTGTDIRETNLWSLVTQFNQSKTYIINKYQVNQAPSSIQLDFKRIPMLRISELYLIAVETAPPIEAQTFWNAYRLARNIVNTPLPTELNQVQAILLPEYRKEFYAEGQAFFLYKRLNAPESSVLWTPSGVNINYIVPLPQGELVKTY